MRTLESLEKTLAQILNASHAVADPAVLARARARLAAEALVPRPIAWLATPGALAAACTLFVAVSVASAWYVGADTASRSDASLVSAMVGDDGSYGLPSATAERASDGSDSGTVTP